MTKRYNISFLNGIIDATVLPLAAASVIDDYTSTISSTKVITDNDVLYCTLFGFVNMALTEPQLTDLKRVEGVRVELSGTTAGLLSTAFATINGQQWEYNTSANQGGAAYVNGGVDTYINNPSFNPSTYTGGVNGQIINTQITNWNINRFWEAGIKGQGIRVAVVDTGGAVGQHSSVQLAGGVNLGDANGSYTDVVGHGLSMAGIIGGKPIGNANGVVGVAPDCQMYSVKAFQSEPPYTNDVFLAAYEWCYRNNINVVNNSYQAGFSDLQVAAIQKCIRDKNMWWVCAAGNQSPSNSLTQIVFPSEVRGVFTIGGKRGGVTFLDTDNIAYNSVLPSNNTGKVIDYLAHTWAVQPSLNNGYTLSNGTSEAGAFFTGALAVLRSLFNKQGLEYLPYQLKAILDKGATTTSAGYKYFQNFNFIKI